MRFVKKNPEALPPPGRLVSLPLAGALRTVPRPCYRDPIPVTLSRMHDLDILRFAGTMAKYA